jgi:hypothetical protein
MRHEEWKEMEDIAFIWDSAKWGMEKNAGYSIYLRSCKVILEDFIGRI